MPRSEARAHPKGRALPLRGGDERTRKLLHARPLAGTPGKTVGAVPLKWFAHTPPLLRPSAAPLGNGVMRLRQAVHGPQKGPRL